MDTMTLPLLPFEPEPLAAIQKRAPKALSRVFKFNPTAKIDPLSAPGNFRDHVFDFEDGQRVIASIDVNEDDESQRVIHVSSGICVADALLKKLVSGAIKPSDYLEMTSKAAATLWPDLLLVEEDRMMTPRCIHFFYTVPNGYPRKA